MSLCLGPAATHAEEIGFSPIPSGMRAHREPESAGAPDCGGGIDCKQRHTNESDAVLAGVESMDPGKQNCQHNSCRPESNAIRQGVERVPAEHILFGQADKQKDQSPQGRPVHDLQAVEPDIATVKGMQRTQREQQAGKRQEAPENISTDESQKGGTL